MIKPAPKYVIKYFQGLFLQETIGENKPMSAATMRWKLKELRRTTHKTGTLIPEPAKPLTI
jgi:hypothetical protein